MKQSKNKHLSQSALMANAALPQVIKGKDLQLAERLATELGETEERAKELLRHIIWVLGAEQVAFIVIGLPQYERSWSNPEMQAALAAEAQKRAKSMIFVQRPTEKASIFFTMVYIVGEPEKGELQRPDWLEIVSPETPRKD